MKTLLMWGLGSSFCVLLSGWSIRAQEISWQATGRNGAVAAGGAESVAAGIGVLERGGRAADAAAATILALSVTDYGMFALGGEVPVLIYDADSRRVTCLSGMGGAPLDPEAIRWYYENGIPAAGSMKAAPVPERRLAAMASCF